MSVSLRTFEFFIHGRFTALWVPYWVPCSICLLGREGKENNEALVWKFLVAEVIHAQVLGPFWDIFFIKLGKILLFFGIKSMRWYPRYSLVFLASFGRVFTQSSFFKEVKKWAWFFSYWNLLSWDYEIEIHVQLLDAFFDFFFFNILKLRP